ncbi:MAG: PKD domain-containing protein [candidate division KSB1 bacterium]|nr:PKD domain-containing protein [candidate division KSB1 bacterium]
MQFDASGSYDPDGGSIQEYIWNFGDGATARGARVSHSYASAGTYTGSLRLRDDEGQETTANFTVNVSPAQTAGPVMVIRITADDQYELYVNGAFVGRGEQWETAEEYRVPLSSGKNVIAVKAVNQGQCRRHSC